MSRTNKGHKGFGWEFWSKRGKGLFNGGSAAAPAGRAKRRGRVRCGPTTKKMTVRYERRVEAKEAVDREFRDNTSPR